MVSPSGTSDRHAAPQLAREPGGDDPLLQAGAEHGLAVDALDPELRNHALARRLGELADRGYQLLALDLDQSHDSLAASLDVDRRVAVAKQHVRARSPGGAAALGALRPAQRSSV